MLMKRVIPVMFALAFGVAHAETIATVNGHGIDKLELDDAVTTAIQLSHGALKDTPQLRDQLKNTLINREVVVQEAERTGLDKQPDFVRHLNETRATMLEAAMLGDAAKNAKISDSDIQAKYNQLVAHYAGSKEMHLRQIVTGSQADAQRIVAQLKKGGNFEALAKSRSIDPAAKSSGGDMGWINLVNLEPPLANQIQSLTKGHNSSSPVQIGNTWRVFHVDDVRTAKVLPLSEVKPQIERQMREEAAAKVLTDLRAKAKIQ
jgi:peptidyl-prolyl cis-trans isomerase C